MSSEHLSLPIDPVSADRLATSGLRMELVDTSDRVAFATWIQAEARGFHDARMSPAIIDEHLVRINNRRSTGVFDTSAAEPTVPVATVSSWPTALTVPGGRSVDAIAISAVTVSPTHRRKGIARAMLEAELRTAARQNVPVAVLTVSETTIYGRYGFAPTAMSVDLTINPARARWIGPDAPGRIHFVSADQLHTEGAALLDSTRLSSAGQIEMTAGHWDRMLGLASDTEDTAKKLRFVRYDNPDGKPEGFAVYALNESKDGFFTFDLDIKFLVSATDDAASGIWRFLLDQDLVSSVTARLRSLDDPISWQVADFRAVSKSLQRDHLWARIIDVPAALGGRTFTGPAEIILDVTDPLGFADGRFSLSVDAAGKATVSEVARDQAVTAGTAHVALNVTELGALYLGGVSATTLARAGRITEFSGGAAAVLDGAFRTAVAPFLNFWF